MNTKKLTALALALIMALSCASFISFAATPEGSEFSSNTDQTGKYYLADDVTISGDKTIFQAVGTIWLSTSTATH